MLPAGAIQLDPSLVVINDTCEYCDHLAELTGQDRDRFVSYIVPENGQYCIAVWANEAEMAALELHSWPCWKAPEPTDMHFISLWFEPHRQKTAREQIGKVVRMGRLMRRGMCDYQREVREMSDWYRRRHHGKMLGSLSGIAAVMNGLNRKDFLKAGNYV